MIIPALVVLAITVGLLPAAAAYRTDVSQSLPELTEEMNRFARSAVRVLVVCPL